MRSSMRSQLRKSVLRTISTLLFTITFLFITKESIAQDGLYPISNGGTVTDCSGFIIDSGLAPSDYSNNEDYTITLCPEAPDTVVTVDFNLFNLGSGDQLTIYDGPDSSSPPIGIFSASDIEGQTFSTGPANASGCLTFHFTSDDSDTGNFSAEITCGYPCEPPVAIVETDHDSDTLLVCIDEEIEFDGTNSTVADGYSIEEYTWDWDDGTESTTGGLVQTHSYDEPGDYTVNLFLTDDNDCSNDNLTQIIVLVSTVPTFAGTTQDQMICVDETVDLELTGDVEPITWDGVPDPEYGGELFIPDNQTQCFQNELLFEGLIPGEVVTSPDDIESIFVNMEHSWMSDLNITITCPNGQSMLLHEQGGGGTYLGDANDDGTDDPGEGFDYYWSPNANNGTWEEESTGVSILPSDTYSATGDWSQLVGCPLNGNWEFEVCDVLGADNGWIFDWTINFDPSLYPDVISFTPEFGIDCDSSGWTLGGAPVPGSDDCNQITVSQSQPGAYDYVYAATDNFGCTYYDTIVVEVIETPVVIVEDSLDYYCGEEVELNAEIENPNPAVSGYDFQWTPSGLVTIQNAPTTFTNGITSTTTYTIEAHPDGMPTCITTEEVVVVVNPPGDPGEDAVEEICESDAPVSMLSLLGGTPDTGGEWTNESDSFVSQTFDPAVDTSGTYTYTVWVEECAYTSQLEIEVLRATIAASADTTICIGGTAELGVGEVSNSGFDITWVWNDGMSSEDSITVQPSEFPEVVTVYGEFENGCFTNEESIVINQYQPLQMNLMDDTTVCYNEEFELEATFVTGGLTPYEYTWTSETGETLNGNGAVTSLTDTTEFCLEISAACETPNIEECVTISVYPQVDSTFTADTLFGCEPLLVNFTPNGDTTAMAVASWSFGDGQSQMNAGVTGHTYETFGEFDVTFEIISEDGCEYSYKEEDMIDVYQVPVAQFSPEPETAILPRTTFDFTNLSFDNDFSEWTFGEFGVSEEINPTIEIPTSSTEIIDVQLVVSNEEGCVDTTSRTVYIQEEFQMYIPNAFTPNGDGINDYFDLTGIDVDPYNFKLYIYDRWGNLVHFTNDITEGWDGSYQRGDHYVPSDVYIYRIETRSLTTKEKKEVVGHVTVIR